MKLEPRLKPLLSVLPRRADELTDKTITYMRLSSHWKGQHSMDITSSQAIHVCVDALLELSKERKLVKRFIQLRDAMIEGGRQKKPKGPPPRNLLRIVPRHVSSSSVS